MAELQCPKCYKTSLEFRPQFPNLVLPRLGKIVAWSFTLSVVFAIYLVGSINEMWGFGISAAIVAAAFLVFEAVVYLARRGQTICTSCGYAKKE